MKRGEAETKMSDFYKSQRSNADRGRKIPYGACTIYSGVENPREDVFNWG